MVEESVTFSRYDTADYLRDERDIQAYLEAALEDGDPAMIALALGNIARARNISQLARETHMSREGVYKALSGRGNPSFATIAKLASALGYRITLEQKQT
ncbi:probable addiction module antidote protein [Modicisalibacter ilicicola DSM 19980]|uniref:Probable addiction module antidote protein n=2 Tax=Modicisalibacter ilicicola TaxID=480814 RepID=A0A1M4ZUN8_9GAMM|nr:probable addiction module antidote protein [Halomonas ilicicola DSM 19980]